MSTTTQPLKYLWTAHFADGHVISQPENDRYSKHDDTAEWNPSAFRDILDYPSEVIAFQLTRSDDMYYYYAVELLNGVFSAAQDAGGENRFSLEEEPLTDRKLIYFREVYQQQIDAITYDPFVNRYIIGYEGKNSENKIEKKVIYING